MEDMRIESPKPKTGVIVMGVLASAVIFGGLGYYIGQMYKTDSTSTATYASPSSIAATTSPTSVDQKTYTSTEYAFSLQHPSDWTISSSASSGDEVRLFAAYPTVKEDKSAYVVTISSTTYDKVIAQQEANQYSELLPLEDITLNGASGKKVTYKDKASGILSSEYIFKYNKIDGTYTVGRESSVDTAEAKIRNEIVKTFTIAN